MKPPPSTAGGPVFVERRLDYPCFGVLGPDGKLAAGREVGLPSERIVELYRAMVLARMADERMLKLQRQGRIGTFPLCSGHEAASCGPVMALRRTDWFVGAFRELGGRLMRGALIENMLLYYGGYEEGNVFPGDERTTPLSVIIASQTLHAVGIGYAMQQKGERDTAVLCFFGDGATSEGDFHEAMNFASVWQVPVVFVCLNNHWAISVPREKQMHSRTIAQKALAYDMPGIQVDGNDVLAMYQAAATALDRARTGGGPSLIEAVTYRMMMHTTADDPTRYRSDDEVAAWAKRDPIQRLRTYLASEGVWDDAAQAKLDADCAQEIDAAVKVYEGKVKFKPDVAFDHVFATPTPGLEAQRAEFLSEIEKETTDGQA